MVLSHPYRAMTDGLFLGAGVFRPKGPWSATYFPPGAKYRFGIALRVRPGKFFPEPEN